MGAVSGSNGLAAADVFLQGLIHAFRGPNRSVIIPKVVELSNLLDSALEKVQMEHAILLEQCTKQQQVQAQIQQLLQENMESGDDSDMLGEY